MSASNTAHSADRGAPATLWLGLLLLIAAGVALAWFSAGSMRGTTTEHGVRIQTITKGNGPLIKAVDGVLIDYEGRLENGTVFDSNAGRQPVPMLAGQVIPGFAEALQHMQKDGRYRIHIPSNLAYGANPPAGGPVPPNANLDFDVHVVQVVPNAALMQQSQAGGAPGQEAPQGQQLPPGAEPQAQPQPQR